MKREAESQVTRSEAEEEEVRLDPGEVAIPLWLGATFVIGGYLLGFGLAAYEGTAGGGDSWGTFAFAALMIIFPHVATKPLLILRLLFGSSRR